MTDRALIVIDVQNEYFPGGQWALPDAERTLPNILHLIRRAREEGEPVVFIQHVTPEGAPVFARGSVGSELRPELGVREEDTLFQKEHPSAFQGTGLNDFLRSCSVNRVDVCGYMTQMCCDTTTREAYSRGYAVRLFSDAMAAKDLIVDGQVVSHDVVHKVHLASQARFAKILTSNDAEI
jgi:nicotinamidase-related amidase